MLSFSPFNPITVSQWLLGKSDLAPFTRAIYTPLLPWIAVLSFWAYDKKKAQSTAALPDMMNRLMQTMADIDGRYAIPKTYKGQAIAFIAPTTAPSHNAAKYYERHIAEEGQIPTRNNGHDFFGALCWLAFPRMKAMINALHLRAIEKDTKSKTTATIGPRGVERDFLTLLDESGVIVAIRQGSSIDWKKKIAGKSWQSLFCEHRQALIHDTRILTLGHALYDKALQPYLSMTGRAFFVEVPDHLFAKEPRIDERIKRLSGDASKANIDSALEAFADYRSFMLWVDTAIANNLLARDEGWQPKALPPLPLWGYPLWHDNQHEGFYANDQVFRY